MPKLANHDHFIAGTRLGTHLGMTFCRHAHTHTHTRTHANKPTSIHTIVARVARHGTAIVREDVDVGSRAVVRTVNCHAQIVNRWELVVLVVLRV